MSISSSIPNSEELSNFLLSILDRAENVSHLENVRDTNAMQMSIVVVDRAVSFLRSLSVIESDDQQQWASLSNAFSDVLVCLQQHLLEFSTRPTTTAQGQCSADCTGGPGRPSFKISMEMLEDLRGFGFSWRKIAKLLGVSRWTVHRRVKEFGLQSLSEFSLMSDDELDAIISDYMNRHGNTTGQAYMTGYLRSLGLRVQRSRVRESISRLDPVNSALRWGVVVTRRKYHVPWPNSLWHIDGHHSLIRWGIVVHGCIDGYSRRIIFLECSSNNLSQTVLSLFLNAIERDRGLWPSRIRVDRGVENVLVCDAMVEARGENRGSFIAGSSTHNQRIERLWREVFRCVLHIFYYVFYAMEDSGILNLENSIHMFTLHHVFLPRISEALHEYLEAFNNHGIRTANNWSPYQMWVNGMMNEANPLAQEELDETPDDLDYYGYDPEGPSPFEESENNVVVPPINVAHASEIILQLQQTVDPLALSTEMGMDIYVEALQIVNNIIAAPRNINRTSPV